MEENQKKKSSGGGFAVGLILICLIAMIIMAVFIWNLICARQADADKINQLTNKVSALNDNIDKLSTSIAKERSEQKDEKTTYTDAELKETLQKVLDLDTAKADGTETIFKKLGYDYDYEKDEKPATKEGYNITTVKFETFKKDMLKYMTENCFEEVWGEIYLDEGGFVCYRSMGATGCTNKVNSITKTEKGYKADVTESSEGPDTTYSVEFTVDENGKIDSYEFKTE